jgi:phenylacetate-coenzyme A ligase PaaK-like adenylate-forming protein
MCVFLIELHSMLTAAPAEPLPLGLVTPGAAMQWTELAWDAALGGWLRPIDILRRSRQRLHAQIAMARALSPLYRQRYRGLPPSHQLVPADLPPLTKQELMADLEASLTDRTLHRAKIDSFLADLSCIGELLDGRYAVWTSSGSTGPPAIFLHDRAALAVYQALELFRFRELASPAYLAMRVLAGERYAMVAATGGHFAGVGTIEHMRCCYPWLAGSVRAISLLQPIEALVAELNAFAPTLVATYPTAGEVLADEQDAGRLKLNLAEIWLGGETLTNAVRNRLQASFGCRARNAYGASEFMSIAWDCGHGSLHVNADWVLLEAVDDRYRPVPPGTASHTVLLTNLVNRVQPLIRYDLGDSITVLPQPCACGSALPAIHVEGRCDDILRFPVRSRPAVRVLPLVLATVLEEHAHVREYQAVQHSAHKLEVRLGDADRSAGARVRAAVGEYLKAQGVARVAIEVNAARPLPSPHSGKLRRVLRLCA